MMTSTSWQKSPLIDRVRWLRYILPPILVFIVIGYQLGIAQALERRYGHAVHYSMEIGFYSLTGPLVTWLTLVWVERRLLEKEALERQVRAQTEQLASLTAVSADAIFSLDAEGLVTSWNQGAEQMLRYMAPAIIGQPLAQLLPEADALAVRLQQRGVVQNFETTAVTVNGRALTVNLTQTQLTGTDETASASLIIMRDVTARREREAILEEERQRIARDLHDGVAQTLYFLALKADMVKQQLHHNTEQALADLEEIRQKARQVIREVRRTIFALRPFDWSDTGFKPALRQFVLGFAEQVGWQAVLKVDNEVAVPDQLEPTIFRLVQEALNNVAKHAGASRVWVTVEFDKADEQFTLTVKDNGRGFDPTATSSKGMGLNQMRARVTAVAGTMHIQSQSDEGTTLTVQLPLSGGKNG
jgi:PAS domain S-box-containing protein